MKIPILNLYYLLAYAWGHSDAARDREATDARVDALPDLLAHVLARRVSSLLKRGLDRSFVEERLDTPGIRGKLDIGSTVKRNLLSLVKTECIVEELRHDVLHNQILRSTLRQLLTVEELDASVRDEVGLAYRKMEGIRLIEVRRSSFRRLRFHRNNRAYGFLMHLCQLLHESLLVDESGTGQFVDVRDDQGAMARIFEEFVANFYREVQSTFRVSSQAKLEWNGASSVIEEDLARLPSMIPDVVLVAPDRRIILDTKFYKKPLVEGRFGGRRLRSTHLYQIFAYVENRNAALPDGPPHEGLLLYPVVRDAFHHEYELKGHRIAARTIDLDQEWWRIRDDLLELIGCRPFSRPAAVAG